MKSKNLNLKPDGQKSCPAFFKLIYVVLFLLLILSFGYSQNPGDAIFKGKQIFDFDFRFKQENFMDSLYQSQQDKEYRPGDVYINGILYDSIGVRFKGTSSFYGYPGDKKSFRIKLNKFKDHIFDGLKKINLNNGYSDPTLLREKLYLDFLHENNIPAPRANFARVYINGTYHGLYSMVENVDKTFLKTRFNNNDGNLFKAEKQADLIWKGEKQESYYEHYALKTNEKENDWSDLIFFIDRLNNSPDDLFENEMSRIFNMQSYIRIWSANNLFMNLDSYLGSANNFYLYNEEQFNRFEFIIWDVNLAFGGRTSKDTLNIFYHPQNRPLIERLLQYEKYKSDYLTAIQEHINNGFNPEILLPKVDSLFEFIKDYYFADTLKMYSNAEIMFSFDENLGNIPGLRPFIKNRYKNILEQLENVTSLKNSNSKQPTDIFLGQNYPNPFNPSTTIEYSVGANYNSPFKVDLSIYNLLGQKVATLVNEEKQTGVYKVNFKNENLPSGIYFYRLFSDYSLYGTRKMIVVK